MKVGTLLFLLIVILIGFGCLFMDNLYAHRDLQLVSAQVDRLKAQLQNSQVQLVSCTDQGQKDLQKIRDLEKRIDGLEDQKKEIEGQLTKANFEITLLRARDKVADVLGSGPFILLATLIFPVVNSIFRSGKILGMQMHGVADLVGEEYVRLTPEERAWVISKRRIERSRKHDR